MYHNTKILRYQQLQKALIRNYNDSLRNSHKQKRAHVVHVTLAQKFTSFRSRDRSEELTYAAILGQAPLRYPGAQPKGD